MTDEAKIKRQKPRITVLPMGWLCTLMRIGADGAEKHGDRSWTDQERYPVQGYVDSTFRHLAQVLLEGIYAQDDESGEYHLHHALWGLMRLCHFLETDE